VSDYEHLKMGSAPRSYLSLDRGGFL